MFFDLCLAPGAPLACAVQLAHQVVLVLALAGRGLGAFGFPGAFAGLGGIGVVGAVVAAGYPDEAPEAPARKGADLILTRYE